MFWRNVLSVFTGFKIEMSCCDVSTTEKTNFDIFTTVRTISYTELTCCREKRKPDIDQIDGTTGQYFCSVYVFGAGLAIVQSVLDGHCCSSLYDC